MSSKAWQKFSLPFLPYLLLTVLTGSAFASTVDGYFVCDDLLHVNYLWRAFSSDLSLLWAPFFNPWLKDTSFYNFYRPLTELSFAFDYLLYGTRAAGFHLTSLGWHIANVCLFFRLVKKLTEMPVFYVAGARERSAIAFLAAAIWAVYPTHTEAVGWIAARSDLMATTFYFTAMYFFGRSLERKTEIQSPGESPLLNLCWALPVVLGFFTKELTISLPFTLLALAFAVALGRRQSFGQSLRSALGATLPALLMLPVYIVCRALAIGDLIGGYVGSIGETLNRSLSDRWLYSQSFFKVFHPFNDLLIPENAGLRLALRLVWGSCGVMTIISTKVGGAIAPKYRFILFNFVWLFLTLAPNLQVWSFSTTMAGGRIAYLPTAPIVLLIVLSVYPSGASALSSGRALAVKAAAWATLIGLATVFSITVAVNNRAWVAVSDMVRSVHSQLADLTDNLPAGKKLALVNLPTNVLGAFAFTAPGMVETLLKPPLATSDISDTVTVLDNQPCSYPIVNASDFRTAAGNANFQLYYYDNEKKLLLPEQDDLNESAGHGKTDAPSQDQPEIKAEEHWTEAGGENFRFKIDPPVKPADYDFVRFKLTLTADARIGNAPLKAREKGRICYLWNNQPLDDEGKRDTFTPQAIEISPAGSLNVYQAALSSSKLWLLSHDVGYMQVFIPYLVDPKSTLSLTLIPEEKTTTLMPRVWATAGGESTADSLLSIKHLEASRNLTFNYDASRVAGARGVKIEILPPNCYFDHYSRKLAAPALNNHSWKVITLNQTRGQTVIKYADFPRAATYQIRACAVDERGDLVGTGSEPITVVIDQ